MKKIYVCYNSTQYTLEEVVQSILDEKYDKSYKFHIGNDLEFVNTADEFWTFGDCAEMENYKKAKELGLDIWVMA